jgi:hypothetical protein
MALGELKMKAIRFSGLPVKLENIDAYKAEWTAEFDKLKDVHKNDMLSLQADLLEIEKALMLKYEVTETWEFLKSKKAVKAKMEQYGAPIMIAQSSENPNELVYVIMDSQLS